MRIFETNLSLRLKCLLLHLGYTDVEELAGLSSNIITSNQGYGEKCVKEINALLSTPMVMQGNTKANAKIYSNVWLERMSELRSKGISYKQAVRTLKTKYPLEAVPSKTWFIEKVKVDLRENDGNTKLILGVIERYYPLEVTVDTLLNTLVHTKKVSRPTLYNQLHELIGDSKVEYVRRATYKYIPTI